MRWSTAWRDESPILVQVRDLLAINTAAVLTALGSKTSPSDLIPSRNKPEPDPSVAIAEYTLFFSQHNARLN